MANKRSGNTNRHQGRRQEDTGTQQSEPNITRQNRGTRENVGNQDNTQGHENKSSRQGAGGNRGKKAKDV